MKPLRSLEDERRTARERKEARRVRKEEDRMAARFGDEDDIGADDAEIEPGIEGDEGEKWRDDAPEEDYYEDDYADYPENAYAEDAYADYDYPDYDYPEGAGNRY